MPEMTCVIRTSRRRTNRLRPYQRESKILLDLEKVHGLHWLIPEPTRCTQSSSSLLDSAVTNKLDLFRETGVYNPVISEHCMVYGVVKERAVEQKNKIVQVRSYKKLDVVRLEELSLALWHVGEVFDLLDDTYVYWETLLKDVGDEYLPIKQMKVRDNDVPYITIDWKNVTKSKETILQDV